MSRIKLALIFELGRTSHYYVIVAFAPFNEKRAARERDRHHTSGQALAGRSDRRRAGAGAARAGEPAPRSQTRSRSASGASLRAREMLARSGNIGMDFQGRSQGGQIICVHVAPPRRCSADSRRSRRSDLREAQVQVDDRGCHQIFAREGFPPSRTAERPCPPEIAPSGLTDARNRPARVSIATFRRPVSAASRDATQRVALPQAETSEPSALMMRMNAFASPFGEGLHHDHLIAAHASGPVGDAARFARAWDKSCRRARRTRRSHCRARSFCEME